VSNTDAGPLSGRDALPLSGRATTFTLNQHQPLHERVPARDRHGQPLADFMVLIPGLRNRPAAQFRDVLARLQAVLVNCTEVVFVDLNVPLNLLWISLQPRPGVILELFGTLQQRIPEARLVGQRWE
jgi:hypothetical protein